MTTIFKNIQGKVKRKAVPYLIAASLATGPIVSCAPISRIEENVDLTMRKVEWRMHLVSDDIKRGIEHNMSNIEKKVDTRMDKIEKKIDTRMNNIEKRIESVIISPRRSFPSILQTNLQTNLETDSKTDIKTDTNNNFYDALFSWDYIQNQDKNQKKLIKKISFESYVPNIEYRKDVKRNKKVEDYLSQIEKVPDSIQKIISDEEGKIVFFNGPLTDNPEMELMKGVKPYGWRSRTYDDLAAVYDPASRTSFIGINGKYVGDSDHTLHEYGHNYDYQVGWHFFGKPLSETPEILKAIKKEPFEDRYYNNPKEYIANSFEKFYNSEKTKKRLEKNNPTIYGILSEMETKSLSEE